MLFLRLFLILLLIFNPLFAFSASGDILSGTGQIEINLPLANEVPEEELENTSTGNILLFPTDFNIIFQNPSYIIDRELEKTEYICDEEKDECKINFILKTPEGNNLSSKLNCEINFGFESNQSQKCNPTTVIFPEGEKKVIFKVYEKNNPQNFTQKEITIINNNNNNNSNVGEAGMLPNPETNTGSILQNTNSGAISQTTSSGILIPEALIEVQSGLEYSGSGELWNCKKEDCKVNLTAENIFTGSFDKKDFECEWSFSGGLYSTGTLEKCNPGYVDYPIGEFLINLKVYEKGNSDNYKESNIQIKNNLPLPKGVPEGGWIINSSTGSENTSSGILIPEALIEVQSGLEYSGTGELWNCKKEECKVNLTAENIFTGSFDKKQYGCEWSFSGGTYSTGTLTKCNPGYVDYSLGEYIISLKILEKGNELNYKESFIIVENKKVIKPIITGGGSSRKKSKKPIIKEIIVQSGLEYEKGKYICKTEVCKVNLKYPKGYKDTCIWNFGGGQYKEKYLYTCNPGIVYFSQGSYNIFLRISKDKILIGEKYISFSNIYQSYKQKNNRKPEARITLQGKMTKSKSFSGNTLVCLNVDKCNINLNGEDSFDIDRNNLSYKWDFGNGEKSEKPNPKAIWYLPGKYTITLEVNDNFGGKDHAEYYIEIIGKNKKIKQTKIIETVGEENFLPIKISEEIPQETSKQMFLKITKILPNPKGSDNNEWIEIKSIGEYRVNLRGLIIDDILDKGSKSYTVKEDIFLEYNEKIRFYKFDTKIALNNSGDEVNLIFNKQIIDSLSWNFGVRDNYILTHENLEIERQEVFVERVIDGDSIVIKLKSGEIEKLRLIGVDTPEIKHPRKKIEFYGKEASKFTKHYLEGKKVILEIDPENYRDKYGRLLGYIFIEENNNSGTGTIFFNQILVESGNARGYFRFPFKYSNDFKKAENIAKKQKLGLWANKEVKKIYLKEARIDKKILEKTIETIEKKNNLFVDTDKNNIPDIYEAPRHYEPDIKISIDKEEVQKKKNTKIIKNITSYNNFIQKSFIIKVSKLRSGLKITGNTLPNSKINLSFGGKKQELISDDKGNFIYFTNNIIEGGYVFQAELTDNLGNIFLINKTKDITLDEEYIRVLNSIKQANILKEIKKKQKKLNKTKKVSKKKTTRKKKVKKEKPITLQISNFIEEEKQTTVIPLFFMKILMFFIFLLSIFLILSKKGIFDPLTFFKNQYREELLVIIE